jgi:membrane protein YdbS with pleckstrin-like domain
MTNRHKIYVAISINPAMQSSEAAGEVSKPHPRMVHVWAIKVMLIPILLYFSPWIFIRLTARYPYGPGIEAIPIPAAIAGAAYVWSSLHWLYYRWQLGEQDLRIWRGILFRKRVTIPYMRIQNVNVVHGPLLLLFRLSAVEVETAGERGRYSPWYRTEGYIPGLVDGEPLADTIANRLQRSKGREGI